MIKLAESVEIKARKAESHPASKGLQGECGGRAV
jgi:hypothetical protein